MKISLMRASGILALVVISTFGYGAKNVFAQTTPDVLYVPLIGITSVPDPLALPKGPGNVTYHYAVKNFLQELPLTDVRVIDDTCSPVAFMNGDDNNNGMLDYGETWRYTCTTKLATTTQSSATVMGTVNGMTATHSAHATVVVGSNIPAPLVSIVNITKVAYPLSLPSAGGNITFTYRVNNPGIVPLQDVTVTDDKCSDMSGHLGDTNNNGLLDVGEVWIYTCTMNLKQTTTNTVTVTAFANGLKAMDTYTLTVKVAMPIASSSSSFPETGGSPDLKIAIWEILSGILAVLIIIFVFIRNKPKKI